MTDKDTWARGLDNATLATGVRSLAPLLTGSHRADEALALVREAARRIEAAVDTALTLDKVIDEATAMGLLDDESEPLYIIIDGEIGFHESQGINESSLRFQLRQNGYEVDDNLPIEDVIDKLTDTYEGLHIEQKDAPSLVYVKDGYPNITIEPEGTVTQGDSRFAQFGTVANACAYYEALGWKREAE